MKNVKGYAEAIRKASPTYVEPKAYMHVGFSRLRMGFENMPSYGQIREFSSQLADETGYRIVDKSEESRVVLLSKLEKPPSADRQ
jgi:tRNA wybutosine-synthesizing protein 1